MVSIMGTPRLPGYDLAAGVYTPLGKNIIDIVFDSIVVSSAPMKMKFEFRVRSFEDTWEVDDYDASVVTQLVDKTFGNVVDYAFLVEKNTFHLTFDAAVTKLLRASLDYKEDRLFGATDFNLVFTQTPVKLAKDVNRLFSREGIFVDEKLDLNDSPDTWAPPFVRPFMVTAGYIHYFPLMVLGAVQECYEMNTIIKDTDDNYIVKDKDSKTWTIPVDIRGDGITLTTDSGKNYKCDWLSFIRINASYTTTLDATSPLIGTWTNPIGEELTISEDEISAPQFKSKFILKGVEKCAVGYAGANTVLMLYYPYIVVHFDAHTYNADFARKKDRIMMYLAAGHNWPSMPSGGGGGGGGGGSSGLLLGLVGLMALAFMAK
jgi:hypothetical protein